MKPVFLILLFVFLCACSGPVPTATELGIIDTSLDPVQEPCRSADFSIETKDGRFTARCAAEYKASVMLVGRESYSSGWNSILSPVDLAVVWGKLAEPEFDRHITYRQNDRWYFYEYAAQSPASHSYIVSHSSNNHIIPATDNVLRAIRSIRMKQVVTLEGLLVNIRGTYKGQRVWWNSSLSRSDTGAGSCELFYVSKVRIGENVFQ
jgi:hypothetical protein